MAQRDVYVGPLQRSGVVPVRCTSGNIELFLAELRKCLYASQGTDQRIGQLIVNTAGSRLFNLEDAALIQLFHETYSQMAGSISEPIAGTEQEEDVRNSDV